MSFDKNMLGRDKDDKEDMDNTSNRLDEDRADLTGDKTDTYLEYGTEEKSELQRK